MEVFALANEGFVIPKREEMQGKLKSTPQTTTPKWISFAAGIFALLVAGYFIIQYQQKTTDANSSEVAKEESAISKKTSIALLQFEDGSPDK